MVAKDEGFFDDNGLEVELVSIGGGSNPTAALMSGQIQVFTGGPEAILASLGGADLVYVAAPSTTIQFWLDTVPSITSVEQLKGKQIAVTVLGSSSHTAAKMAVRSLGLDPDKDVIFTAVNNPPTILAALQNGAVPAASIGSPNRAAALKAGMHEWVDVAQLKVPFPNGWDIMARDYVNAHQDLTQRYVKSVVQALAFEMQYPEETQRIMGKYSQNNDAAQLKASYDLVSPFLRKVPMPETEGVRNALQEQIGANPKAATADPASFVDQRWVKALQDSGYIDSLYASASK
jgi:NitT/TauT family transport system substrate-binding protein